MSGITYIDDTIEKKLLDLNVAYFAKVLSISGETAKIQPLGMIKQKGETAKAKSPITDVPILHSAQYKSVEKEIEYVSNVTISTSTADGYVTSVSPKVTKKKQKILVKSPLKVGDIVFCVCADRDITDARNGKNSVPSIGHHSITDSVIVGVL